MKIMTILGTRPEIIRLSRVIPLLDELDRYRIDSRQSKWLHCA